MFISENYNVKYVKILNDIKTNKIINNRKLFNNNNKKEENCKDKFFVKNYNINLFSYEQLKSDFINLANNNPSNMTIDNYFIVDDKYCRNNNYIYSWLSWSKINSLFIK